MKKLGVRNNNLQMSPQLQHYPFLFPQVSINVQIQLSNNNQPSLMTPFSYICNHMGKKGSEQNPSPEVNCIFAPGLLANLYLYMFVSVFVFAFVLVVFVCVCICICLCIFTPCLLATSFKFPPRPLFLCLC